MQNNDNQTNQKDPPKQGSKWIRVYLSWTLFYMAGMEGFEPPNAWTKTRCLTTWPHPNALDSIP